MDIANKFLLMDKGTTLAQCKRCNADQSRCNLYSCTR